MGKLATRFAKRFEQFADITKQYDSQEALSCLIQMLVDAGMPNVFGLKQQSEQDTFLKINVKTEFTTMNEAIVDVTKDDRLTEFPKFLQLHLLRYVFD